MESGDDAVLRGLCAGQSGGGEGFGVVAVTLIVISMCVDGLHVCMYVWMNEFSKQHSSQYAMIYDLLPISAPS